MVFSNPLNTLYKATTEGTFQSYVIQGAPLRTTRQAHYIRSHQLPTLVLPTSALPTTTLGTGPSYRHTGTSPISNHPPTVIPEWHGIVLHPPDDFEPLILGIQSGTAIAVTDGTFKDGLGAAAFVISPTLDSPSTETFTLVNHTPGSPQDMDAYRAELGGIYGIIRTVQDLCQAADVHQGSVTIACDCVSALRNITSPHNPPPSRPHHDMLSAIRHMLRNSPLSWSFQHVRGHQDDSLAYQLLNQWAQHNVDMDAAAKSYWTILRNQQSPPHHLQPLPGQWSIWHRDSRFTSWTLTHAQHVYYRTSSTTFWNKRLGDANAFTSFDWSSTSKALSRLPTYQRLWIPKWVCSTLPIGKNLERWGQPAMAACPRCGQPELHTHHVIHCNHIEAVGIRNKHLKLISETLDTTNTEPSIQRGIISLITNACSNHLTDWHHPPILNTTPELVTKAFEDQLRLGTTKVLDGFLSPTWAKAQQAHYEHLGRRTTGHQWMSKLIRMIWQIAWDLWIHRRRIKDSLDNQILPAMHMEMDDAITSAFAVYQLNPNPSLSRWFNRTPQELHAESLDWKGRWLEMIQACTQQNTTEP